MPVTAVLTVDSMIIASAKKWDVNEGRLRKTLFCESSLNPNAIGDEGESFGIAQIHLPSHPEITESQALNPSWAIDYMAQKFSEGEVTLWSCWRVLYG